VTAIDFILVWANNITKILNKWISMLFLTAIDVCNLNQNRKTRLLFVIL